jgi:hypothetical protein
MQDAQHRATLQRIASTIDNIRRLTYRPGSRVPVFLLDGVADEGEDGGFEGVGGGGGEDDVFELVTAGELRDQN